MCKCVNIRPQSEECYAQQIVVSIPPHMGEYKSARLNAGLSAMICIDPCIMEEIKYLWELGINTYGCCCGHNTYEPMVNVGEKDIKKMLQLGYVQNHPDKMRKDTFKLKSV